MKVSVVISTYTLDMYEEFTDAADSVLSQTYDDVEMVIIIDGSERSGEVYERAMADYGDRNDVTVHENEENVGVLEGRNTGAELATGDVVAFMDDDAIADETWVEELVDTYERHDAIAVGGRMDPRWVAERPTFLPEEFYWLIGVTHKGFPEEETEVRNTFASNISFKRDVFLSLDGFKLLSGERKGDQNIQGGETELAARMRQEYDQGVMYNPDAVVEHKVYEYRTDPKWLLDRAFWQGYSKRAMEVLLPDSGSEETDFLSSLVLDFTPERLKGLVTSPSIERGKQLVFLWVFTITVGLGYLYGFTHWRGGSE